MSTLPILSRRAVLAGTTAALTLPAAAVAIAADTSVLDELVADYRLAVEALSAADAEVERLQGTVVLPDVEVRCGRRRRRDPETGTVTFESWCFSYPYEVERHFAVSIEGWLTCTAQAGYVAEQEAQRDRLMADLQAQWDLRAALEQSAGITAAEALADHAAEQMFAIRKAVFAFQPTSMAEVATKNAFVLEMLRLHGLSNPQLEAIFGAAAAAR
ncbi:MAG: hypothetical protein K2Z25_22450 [Beijerinckiaceae bacterium]|nr:hypothetical protein [Beijerinckiaceae bacterium]